MTAGGYYGIIVDDRCFVAYQPTDMHLFRHPAELVRAVAVMAGSSEVRHRRWLSRIAERLLDDMDTLRHPDGALVSVIADLAPDRDHLVISRGGSNGWVSVRACPLDSPLLLERLADELAGTQDRGSTYGNLTGGRFYECHDRKPPRTLADTDLTCGVFSRPSSRAGQPDSVRPVDPAVAAVRRAEARGVPNTATPAANRTGSESQGDFCGKWLGNQMECRNWVADGGRCHLHGG